MTFYQTEKIPDHGRRYQRLIDADKLIRGEWQEMRTIAAIEDPEGKIKAMKAFAAKPKFYHDSMLEGVWMERVAP